MDLECVKLENQEKMLLDQSSPLFVEDPKLKILCLEMKTKNFMSVLKPKLKEEF
jgi:hypothetical protein